MLQAQKRQSARGVSLHDRQDDKYVSACGLVFSVYIVKVVHQHHRHHVTNLI